MASHEHQALSESAVDLGLATYQAMSKTTCLQSLGQTSTHPSIIPGCASFASCIDLSRAYAVKVDIDAIESTAKTLLAAGKGIDHDVMSDHMGRIQQMGMSAALLSFSGQTLPTTLHPPPSH